MIKIMQNIGKKRSNKAVFSTFMHYSWYFQWEPLRKALFWGAPQWVRRVVCSGNSVSWLPGHTEWAGSNISGSCFFFFYPDCTSIFKDDCQDSSGSASDMKVQGARDIIFHVIWSAQMKKQLCLHPQLLCVVFDRSDFPTESALVFK